MSFLKVDVVGLQRLQAAHLQMMIAINPKGGLGKAVKEATLLLFRYSVTITHVLTGSLQASHTTNFGAGSLVTSRFFGGTIRNEAVGHITINPRSRNPVTGEKPVEYGPVEHDKGGSHAFYERTVRESGSAALTMAHRVMMGALPRGGAYASTLRGGGGVVNLLGMFPQ